MPRVLLTGCRWLTRRKPVSAAVVQDVNLNLCGCSRELLIFVQDQGGTRDEVSCSTELMLLDP